MSVINLEMKDITLVDQPVQAIMVCMVEELVPEAVPEQEVKKVILTCEDACLCLMLTPLVIALLPFTILYAPIYIYGRFI
jgi:hypothetical protein